MVLPCPCDQGLHPELKMQSKLEWTRRLTYPLVVVSFEEMEPVEEEDSFRILDALWAASSHGKSFQRRISSVPEEGVGHIAV
jgi:hypothetical protein